MNEINSQNNDLRSSLEYSKGELSLEKKVKNTQKIIQYAKKNASNLLIDENKFTDFLADVKASSDYLAPIMLNDIKEFHRRLITSMMNEVKNDKKLLKKIINLYAFENADKKKEFEQIAVKALYELGYSDEEFNKKVFLKTNNKRIRKWTSDYISDRDFHNTVVLNENMDIDSRIYSMRFIKNVVTLKSFANLSQKEINRSSALKGLKIAAMKRLREIDQSKGQP